MGTVVSLVARRDRDHRRALADGYRGAAHELAAWASISDLTPDEAELMVRAVALLHARANLIRKDADRDT